MIELPLLVNAGLPPWTALSVPTPPVRVHRERDENGRSATVATSIISVRVRVSSVVRADLRPVTHSILPSAPSSVGFLCSITDSRINQIGAADEF